MALFVLNKLYLFMRITLIVILCLLFLVGRNVHAEEMVESIVATDISLSASYDNQYIEKNTPKYYRFVLDNPGKVTLAFMGDIDRINYDFIDVDLEGIYSDYWNRSSSTGISWDRILKKYQK